MRERLDWIVPIGVGVSVALTIAIVGGALGWSDGLVTVLALLGMQVGVVLRVLMHDYQAELERTARPPRR